MIVGNAVSTGNAGYWMHQFRTWLTGRGLHAYDEATLTCYLKIAAHMSAVFGERTAAGTFAQAEDVLFVNKTSSMTELFDQQLLAAWLNFADGAIPLDRLVDTNGDKVGDMTFLDAVVAAERVRLDPGATRLQLEAQKILLERINQP